MVGIIPAAGLGTRLKSIAKGKPKELLSIQNKPMIQWAIEEGLKSDLSKVIIIISPEKKEIKKFFENWNKIDFVYQYKPMGVVDAILKAQEYIEDKFALILPDNIFIGASPLIKLTEVADKYDKSVTALIEVKDSEAEYFGNCGKVKVKKIENDIFEIKELGDKLSGDFSTDGKPSCLRQFPRHILKKNFFGYAEKLKPNIKGEFDDVPVFQQMIKNNELLGVLVRGKAFDVGNIKSYKKWK